MAAAAAWIAREAPDGVAVFVASDHHIPDAEAFRAAVLEALPTAASGGRIVTFGVRPTEPASGLWLYPARRAPAWSPVAAFVEKPDAGAGRAPCARRLSVEQRQLRRRGPRSCWRSWTPSRPEVARGARASVPQDGRDGRVLLATVFRPRRRYRSTMRSWRQPPDLGPAGRLRWSDLGAWDAGRRATGAGDRGSGIAGRGRRTAWCARRRDGGRDRGAGQPGRHRRAGRRSGLRPGPGAGGEGRWSNGCAKCLRITRAGHRAPAGPWPTARAISMAGSLRALPLWSALGVDQDGGFREAIDLSGRPRRRPAGRGCRAVRPMSTPRPAGRLGRAVAAAGHAWTGRFEADYRRADGLYRTLVRWTARCWTTRPCSTTRPSPCSAWRRLRQGGRSRRDAGGTRRVA